MHELTPTMNIGLLIALSPIIIDRLQLLKGQWQKKASQEFSLRPFRKNPISNILHKKKISFRVKY